MDIRRRAQILAAHDMCHALPCIVDDHREVIAGRCILARQHDVAVRGGIGDLDAGNLIVPFERCPAPSIEQGERGGTVEAPRRAAFLHPVPAAARPRIDRTGRAVRRRSAGGDIGAGAVARIEQVHRLQPLQRGGIGVKPRGLEQDLAIPCQTEPGEILDDPEDVFRARARPVDILDPQEEGPAVASRAIMALDRRESVAKMQLTRRARRETGDDAAHRRTTP